MKKIYFFLFLNSLTGFVTGQPSWQLFLGNDMETQYSTKKCWKEKDNGFSYICFADYPLVRYSEVTKSNSDEIQRLGII
ncbi:MAG: hypothetical protein ABIT58_07710 [Ferruginibacter sp.]